MAVNVNETEAKYDAPAGAALPRLDDLPQVASTSGPDEEQLEAEYYDTDDLRLNWFLYRISPNASYWNMEPPATGWRRPPHSGHGTRASAPR